MSDHPVRTEAQSRLELAVVLFRQETLTLAQASRLAGIDHFAFQSVLADREIPLHYGIGEFNEDLRTLDKLGRS